MSMFQTSFVKARLKEPSTWAGLAVALGMGAQAVQTKDPTAIGSVIGGILAMFLGEKGGAVSQEQPTDQGK